MEKGKTEKKERKKRKEGKKERKESWVEAEEKNIVSPNQQTDAQQLVINSA